jgi:hypothetical protein
MATAVKPTMKQGVEEGTTVHRIRITLTSKSVKNLEKGGLQWRPASRTTTSWRSLMRWVLL